MRAPHQVLELAVGLLGKNPTSRRYMCCHLEWMWSQDLITEGEMVETKSLIMGAINNHVTLAAHLRGSGVMPRHITVHSEVYVSYQLKFYRELIAQLQQE